MTLAIILVLLVMGFLLLLVEALTPGVHVFGIMGGLMVLGSVAYTTVKFGPRWGAVVFVSAIALFGAVIFVAIKSGTWKRLTLQHEQRRDAGYRSDDAGINRHIGKQGKALYDLRPVGYVDLSGERVEAVSESEFVKKGDMVEVVRVDAGRLVVRPMAPEVKA